MHPPLDLPAGYPRVRVVESFSALATARFCDGVNALCWPRALTGDFAAVVAALGAGEGVVVLAEEQLRALPLSPAGRAAVAQMLADQALLRGLERDPVLNCIHAYPHDTEAGAVATDVYSFHADSAPIEADTWLCTYHGPPSEALRHEDARRRIDIPETRAALLREYGGRDDDAFAEHLRDLCYDLHYAAAPAARPFSFGIGHLWRIAVEHPGAAVPPCVHRAPTTRPGETRLLLIS